MNQKTFEKLQYNQVKNILSSYCTSNLGVQLVEKLKPSTHIRTVRTRLQETEEAKAIINTDSRPPFFGLSGIDYIIDNLDKGMVLDPEQLMQVHDFLRGCRKMKRFMEEKVFYAPLLSTYVLSLTEFTHIEEEIIHAISGNSVLTTASKELKRIRGSIATLESKINERLEKFMRSGQNKQYIQDFFVSMKDGRYTIPIKASYKNMVNGTIVETSSKGTTAFIEPEAVSKLNTQLANLKIEETMEEYQILATLSGLVAEEIHTITTNIDLIAQYDLIFAKGKYSKDIEGITPIVNQYGYIHLRNCKHPLLTGHVVPLNLELGQDYRTLVITGPNAGGKTVVLKTVGLLSLCVMSGLQIIADEGTNVAIFDQIFVDIGDEQSIENALSTFSSHMRNLSDIMREVNNNTLLLFDEIGSGTEPNEGAALAIAILEELYLCGCITIATTHYGEIKRYTEQHPDFLNAAMQFDKDTLEPQYRLLTGRSGDSNALWIAKKMNLRDKVINNARQYIENKEYEYPILRDDKRKKAVVKAVDEEKEVTFAQGDRVLLLDHEESAIVYKGLDKFNNLIVYYNGEMMEVNDRRVKFEVSASELYPAGYDMTLVFMDYHVRKRERDINRGSKKMMKTLRKEEEAIRKQK